MDWGDVGNFLQKVVVAPFLPVIAPLGFLNGGKTLSDVSGGLLSPEQAKDAGIAEATALALIGGWEGASTLLAPAASVPVGYTGSTAEFAANDAAFINGTPAMTSLVEGGVSNPATSFASAPAAPGSGFFGTLGKIGGTFSKFITGAAALSNSAKQIAQTWLGGGRHPESVNASGVALAPRSSFVGSGGGGPGLFGGGVSGGASAASSPLLLVGAAALAGYLVYRWWNEG